MENKNLVPNEEFYLLLPPKEQLKNALIKPEFFFIKKKKKRTPSQANKFSSSKWLKIITVFDVFYLVLGYFTDMLGIDDYIVFASMVLGGILYLIEKYGKLQLPEVCFFCVNQEFIQYHFETGVKVELLKFARLLGFSKPKTIHFKSIENIEIQFKGITFKLLISKSFSSSNSSKFTRSIACWR